MSVLFAGSLAPGRPGLEFLEQRIETLVAPFEELAVPFNPIHGLLQSLQFQFAWTPLRIDVHRDEASALKHFQVFGNGWLAHLERLSELRHGRFACCQPRKNGTAGGIGESGKGEVEAFRSLHNLPFT